MTSRWFAPDSCSLPFPVCGLAARLFVILAATTDRPSAATFAISLWELLAPLKPCFEGGRVVLKGSCCSLGLDPCGS
jgi:hypothetical protein